MEEENLINENTNRMKYDVIIIGAGLGGLTAGAKLARSGKKVLIVEQHNIPGGCATTFRRKEYTVEVGLHELDGLDETDAKTRIFKDLDVFNNTELVRLPEFFKYKNARIEFVMPDDTDKAIDALTREFPSEEKGIRKYFRQLRGIRKEVPKIPGTKFWQTVLMPLYPLLFPNVVKNAKKSIGSFLDENINNDDLKLILTANLNYYHNDPYTMSMLYFATAQDGYYAGGWYIKGGSQKLSDYLAGCVLNNSGDIVYGHLVEKILIEQGEAKGIVFRKKTRGDSGQIIEKAKVIIANCAVPNLVDLLPEPLSLKFSEKIKDLQHSCSIITLYLGFSKTPKELGNKHYSTFIANPDVKNLRDFAHDLKYAGFKDRHLIFVDYSQIDSGLTPEGRSFGVLATTDYAKDWDDLNREEYKKKKEEVAQILMERLEKLIPGIKEYIDYYELGTAKTVERYTLNPGGACYGFAQLPEQAGANRFGQFPPVRNLYIASAWGHPGGGFTGVIISGYLTALKVK